MTHRFSLILLLTVILFTACNSSAQNKKYSITQYFMSYDSSDNSRGQQGKRFKYTYEEFNADSNLIYQEIYANTGYYGDMWGKLIQKTSIVYSDKLKMKEIIEVVTPYVSREGSGDKGTYTYTYTYNGKNLAQLLYNNKIVESYQYNENNQLTVRTVPNTSNIPDYYKTSYSNELKIRTQHFIADTIIGTDSFLYDQNKRRIETISRYSDGKMADTVIQRNDQGVITEKKWREYYQSNSDYPFYHVNKYDYDDHNRLRKIEYYIDHKLTTVFEFKYD